MSILYLTLNNLFHELSGWLNLYASWNILCISVTDDTSHESRDWLNEDALKNIAFISVIDDKTQELIGWLNDKSLARIATNPLSIDFPF